MRSDISRLGYALFVVSILVAATAGAAETPKDLRGTEIRQHVVKWEWEPVPGAARYEVMMNGIDYGSTWEPKFYTYYMYPGEYTFKVRAYNEWEGKHSAWTGLVKIRTSEVFAYGTHGRSVPVGNDDTNDTKAPTTRLPQVTGIRHTELTDSDVLYQWDPVDGAVEYEVTVDGTIRGRTSDTQWLSTDFWVGEHSITVKAVDSSGNMSEQSDTLKILFSGNAGRGDTSRAASPPPPAPVQTRPAPPLLDVSPAASLQPANTANVVEGDQLAHTVESFIDPASWNYSEASNKPGYELVFSDEFNGTQLNPYRWNTSYRWDGEFNGERREYRVINGEEQFYVNVLTKDREHRQKAVPLHNPFKFDGNRLGIQAIINPVKDREKTRYWGGIDDILRQQQFLSGALSTHDKFAIKYGYFEARIKIPSHVGAFPAFWLNHQRHFWENTRRTEIDIMESLGHAPWYVYNSFHTYDNVSRYYSGDAKMIKPYPSGQVRTGPDYSENYHTYAVKWEPGRVIWYIDGVETSRLDDGRVDYEELYVLINLAMGGYWTNFDTTAGGLGRPRNEHFPNSRDLAEFASPMLEIDYIRIYAPK